MNQIGLLGDTPNKRMHATRDTLLVIQLYRAGGRVMRGVRLLLRFEITTDEVRGRGGWRSGLMQAWPAAMHGLTSWQTDGGRHGVG